MSEVPSFYRRFGKRALDLSLTLLMLPIVLPVALLVALAIRLTLGSPILFRHERIGWGEAPFVLCKFRTMRDLLLPNGQQAPDSERLTRLGSFLRRTSLDELPELLHVVSGRMSLIGPRPLLPRYIPRYSARQSRRHEVRPGLTGLAQVSGRNALSWKEKLELDIVYVESLSFGHDLTILVHTIWAVVKGKGVAASGHATMPEFQGTSSDGISEEEK